MCLPRESRQRDARSPLVPPVRLLEVKVREVLDGDTVIVSDSGYDIRIRLSSIDCPEDGQPWGDIAKAGLIKLIGGRRVRIETHGTDVYERTVATIFVQQDSKWINVNERMVMLGHAWVMRQYYGHLSKQRRIQLDRLERWAKTKRVGLWKTENPVPPWLWRDQMKGKISFRFWGTKGVTSRGQVHITTLTLRLPVRPFPNSICDFRDQTTTSPAEIWSRRRSERRRGPSRPRRRSRAD
ncbi:MAG: thermonuclease family protein [Bdellovibrionaceae bacterium]|nr:thermonuclease family protein [Pseudobdellovibrionaceae bacterium]MBX3033262.1 thermonuclease family protein [Pseudobdellovibrionaceae bacterium]